MQITCIGKDTTTWDTGSTTVHETGGIDTTYTNAQVIDNAGNGRFMAKQSTTNTGYPDIYADLTNATAATVTQLREAIALQRYKEARALYGDRYVDYLRYLGATPSDARLQRPEYLGGGKQAMQVSEIIQSAPRS